MTPGPIPQTPMTLTRLAGLSNSAVYNVNGRALAPLSLVLVTDPPVREELRSRRGFDAAVQQESFSFAKDFSFSFAKDFSFSFAKDFSFSFAKDFSFSLAKDFSFSLAKDFSFSLAKDFSFTPEAQRNLNLIVGAQTALILSTLVQGDTSDAPSV